MKPILTILIAFCILGSVQLYLEFRQVDSCLPVRWEENFCDSYSLYRIKIFNPSWRKKVMVGEFTARCVEVVDRKFYRLKQARSISYVATPNAVAPISEIENIDYDYDNFLVPKKQAEICRFEVMR